jgi:hypothetical protein
LTLIERAELLLVSEVSTTTPSASDLAMMYHVPVAVPGGIVMLVEETLDAPPARAGTARPPSDTSAASKVLFVDR